jgi:ribosome-binding factor A
VSRRTERIAEEVRGELARLLREEVTDPRIGLVTLTRVDVAPDLRSALVFWSCTDDAVGGASDPARVQEAETGLASASAFLRRGLARALPTKRVPELRFRHDPSLALGSDMLALLREIQDDPAKSS